ncbi:MAG: ComF family protein [Alphaproteobacteria bacterium]|nr:ComF family protein [Alphaproteobacteria bacterium]
MITAHAWSQLNFIAEPQCTKCGIPFEFESFEGMTCTACLDREPPFETARAALKYDDASRDMILRFKHADQIHVVLAFVPWMEKAGAEMLAQADYLIPVPLHRWRLLSRRYNQSALIAHALSRKTKIPTLVDGVLRTRATEVQGYKKAVERHKNVKKAFAVNPKRVEQIKGKNLILIDDVYTTGATVKECAKTLVKAGAARVDVLTLARVVRDDLDF